ncbi:MAG: ferrous iron transport protein A [Spirochaetales bacterium]
MTKQLRDLPVGSLAKIDHIEDTHRSYRSKLLSMGLTKGTVIWVKNIAPFGDPVLVAVRDYELSLRKDEASAVVLEPIEGNPEDFGFRHSGHSGSRGWGRGKHRNERKHKNHVPGRGGGRGFRRRRGQADAVESQENT